MQKQQNKKQEQLKRNVVVETLDFGKYDKLKKIFFEPQFDPEQIEELELSHERTSEMPNVLCLQPLINLKVLVLSNNQIGRFDGIAIAKELQNLEILDLGNNLIEEMDDLADMNLPNLRILDYQGNYVCTYLQRITQIEQLLCPKRYEKYNPVKIFTASYNQLPVGRLSEAAYIQEQKDLRTIQRAPEEFKPEELMNTVSKYSHKNTLGKFALELCPIPRKTRFRNLEYVNGTQISKLDVIRVTGVDNFKLILDNQKSVKRGVVKAKKSQLHEEYIKKYTKRITRLLESDIGVHDSDDILKAKKQKQLDPKKFSIWETPLDIKYKDAEFTIGIDEYKKQRKDHEQQKKDKLDKKRRRQIQRIKKRHPSFDEDDSDPELRRILYNKKNKVKPKLNLSDNESKVFKTSESSSDDENSEQEKNDKEQTEEYSVIEQQPKVGNFIQTSSVSTLRRQLEKKDSHHSNDQKKKNSRAQTAATNQRIKDWQQEDSSKEEQEEEQQQGVFGHSGNRRFVQSQTLFKKDNSPLPHQPIPAQRILTKMKYEENRNTFDVNNKLSASHPIVRQKDYKEQLEKRMSHVKDIVMKEREELNQLQKKQEPEQKKEYPKKQVRIIVNTDVKKRKTLKEPIQREIVKIHGDLDKSEYQRAQIPIEDLIPTEEQGVPAKFRQEFLFDVDSQAHKDLLHYKAILEESMNLREAWMEMDGKLEILGATKPDKELKFKALNFNTIHDYLKDKYKDKINPYEMREIIYGANDYEQQTEPKILEKDVVKQLQQENIPQEEKQILYKWIEILDDIRLKSIKPNERRLRRMEIKEIERAQSFAHLAYHYQKLKKYVSEERLQQYVKMMGIPLNEIIQQDGMMKIRPNSKKKKEPVIKETQYVRVQKEKKITKKEPDLAKQMQQIQEDKCHLLQEYGQINQQRYSNVKADIMSPNGHLAQNDPYLKSFLTKMEKKHNQVMTKISDHQVPFENMVEQNLRKLQDKFISKQGPSGIEEQMMKYASEFKEKIKQRERLQQNIKQHINDTRQKLDEFWMWENKERESRYDSMAILMRSIKRMEHEIDNPSD